MVGVRAPGSRVQDKNARLGVYTPIVCTPEELMEV